jgi:hypothetical protein
VGGRGVDGGELGRDRKRHVLELGARRPQYMLERAVHQPSKPSPT